MSSLWYRYNKSSKFRFFLFYLVMPFSRFGAKTSLVNGVKMATCLLSTLVFIFTSRYGLTCSKAHYHVFCPNEKLNCPDFKTLWRYLHTEKLIAIKWLMSLWGPCKVKSSNLEVLLFYKKIQENYDNLFFALMIYPMYVKLLNFDIWQYL